MQVQANSYETGRGRVESCASCASEEEGINLREGRRWGEVDEAEVEHVEDKRKIVIDLNSSTHAELSMYASDLSRSHCQIHSVLTLGVNQVAR